MKILLTGGSGDLGQMLTPLLTERGHKALIFDIRSPSVGSESFINGSLLKTSQIESAVNGCDLVVHIAAWHGIHETRGLKTPQEFWDLNVNGTRNLLEACTEQEVSKLIHISSSSISKRPGHYGFTKRLAEETVAHYHQNHGLQCITLRPRAFIPPWNREVYDDFEDWAKRFWPGAVHIQDVAQAVMLSMDYLTQDKSGDHPVLAIDREPDYPAAELSNWDAEGPGSSFRKYYGEYEKVVSRFGLDPSLKPVSHDIQLARTVLGYQPNYSLKSLLQDLTKRP